MQAAVIPSKGIGDGLIMMVASYQFKREGYQVTTFHDTLGELEEWFPGQCFAKRSSLCRLELFDRIVFQNENTPFARALISRYRRTIHVLYASYERDKHFPFTDRDVLLNRSEPFVRGVARSIATLLGKERFVEENGLVVPQKWVGQKDPKRKPRVAIHPTGTLSSRRWSPHKFVAVAKQLEQEGCVVAFCVSPSERQMWGSLLRGRFLLPELPTLSALAKYLYESDGFIGNESGPGHLASNLGIPTLIVARSHREMALWRPGFRLGNVVTPPSYIPNLKRMRLRDQTWQMWISSRAVLKAFKKVSPFL